MQSMIYRPLERIPFKACMDWVARWWHWTLV